MNLDAFRYGLVLKPVVEIVADPMGDAMRMVEQAQGGAVRAPPTSWMQRHRQRGQVQLSEPGRVPTFEGRVCCYEHLRRFDGREDLQMPFETTCPGCARIFRVTLGAVPRR